VALLAATFTAIAAQQEAVAGSPDWLQLGLGLFGGLALFLAGLDQLSEGMKKAAGHALTEVLERLTTSRFLGALTGAFITAVLNSSTVTTLLVVGFISGGMMTLAQSVGVIMGANIGSTMTAQLLAFDLSAYSLGPVAIGFFMLFTAKREQVRYYGMMLMGIGLVFYGMGLMGGAMTPLRSYGPSWTPSRPWRIHWRASSPGRCSPPSYSRLRPRSVSPSPWPAEACWPCLPVSPWPWGPTSVRP